MAVAQSMLITEMTTKYRPLLTSNLTLTELTMKLEYKTITTNSILGLVAPALKVTQVKDYPTGRPPVLAPKQLGVDEVSGKMIVNVNTYKYYKQPIDEVPFISTLRPSSVS